MVDKAIQELTSVKQAIQVLDEQQVLTDDDLIGLEFDSSGPTVSVFHGTQQASSVSLSELPLFNPPILPMEANTQT